MAKQNKVQKQTQPQQTAAMTVSLQDLDLDVAKKKKDVTTGYSIWIRSLMQNWRQGTVSCKGRSDVQRSNKKPWKQKGTGRARAGSARSPLWRGGGVIFGPQPRVRTLKTAKKMRKGVLNTILFDYVENNKVTCVDWLPGELPKTSSAHKALVEAGLVKKKLILLLPVGDAVSHASFVNMPNVKVLFFDQANAFDLTMSGHWIVLKKDLVQFKEAVSRWI